MAFKILNRYRFYENMCIILDSSKQYITIINSVYLYCITNERKLTVAVGANNVQLIDILLNYCVIDQC